MGKGQECVLDLELQLTSEEEYWDLTPETNGHDACLSMTRAKPAHRLTNTNRKRNNRMLLELFEEYEERHYPRHSTKGRPKAEDKADIKQNVLTGKPVIP